MLTKNAVGIQEASGYPGSAKATLASFPLGLARHYSYLFSLFARQVHIMAATPRNLTVEHRHP